MLVDGLSIIQSCGLLAAISWQLSPSWFTLGDILGPYLTVLGGFRRRANIAAAILILRGAMPSHS